MQVVTHEVSTHALCNLLNTLEPSKVVFWKNVSAYQGGHTTTCITPSPSTTDPQALWSPDLCITTRICITLRYNIWQGERADVAAQQTLHKAGSAPVPQHASDT